MTKRFRIGSEIFEFASASDVTLRDLLAVEKESAELGHPIHMGEIVRLSELFQTLTPQEARYHAESGWMLAITIWMSKIKKLRDAGDFTTRISLGDAIDFPLDLFEPLPDLEDRKAPAGKAPRKRTSSGSARAARGGGSPAG